MINMSENECKYWYLAAAIECDGSISFTIYSEPTIQIQPKIQVGMMGLMFQNNLKRLFGGHVTTSGCGTNTWVHPSKLERVVQTLEHVVPKLIIKKERGELLLKYCKSRLRKLRECRRLKKRLKPYSEKELKWLDRIQQLNTKRADARKHWIRNYFPEYFDTE